MVFVPDFKLCLPGGCNAKCSFCFAKNQIKENPNWIENLKDKLEEATEQFPQLNITGGEPTISPFYNETLQIIKQFRNKFTKVVMTTNGTNLIPEDLKGIVDFVNISRHHYNNEINEKIFKTNEVPTTSQLKDLIKRCKNSGVQPTLSLTITDDFSTKEDVEKMIKFCKKIKVAALIIRSDYHKGTEPSDLEFDFANIPAIHDSYCEVCRVKVQVINDVMVTWVNGVVEPYEVIKRVREVILQPTGELSFDYKGKYKADFKTLKVWDGVGSCHFNEKVPITVSDIENVCDYMDKRHYIYHYDKKTEFDKDGARKIIFGDKKFSYVSEDAQLAMELIEKSRNGQFYTSCYDRGDYSQDIVEKFNNDNCFVSYLAEQIGFKGESK